MKTIVLAFLSLLFICDSAFAQQNYSKYFADEAIRYDYELVGDKENVEVIPTQIKILPHWGGQAKACIDELNLGNFNFELIDLKTGEIIFRKGFCTLFWEWQTTAEATQNRRSFYQALHFPKPLIDVKLLMHQRDESNGWRTIFVDTIRVANYFMIHETPIEYAVDTILYNGQTADKIDIVILAEGYRVSEFGKFKADSKRLSDSLFNAEPFKSYQSRFNVWAVEVPSQDSGTDVPGNRIYKNTAFNSHFYTFDSPRYLTTTDMKSVYDAIDFLPFDHIYVLVNTERYGGGGFYNFMNVCSADNERSPFVFCHEFGHGFAGLGDEYYTSSTSYESFFKKTIEPWEANLTTLVEFDSKWKNQMEATTPIPTPRDSSYLQTIGVFEGGGYEAKGIYSPAMSCWMKERKAGKFCPICTSTIEKVILSQTK
ncbi:MAG: M64 family metallopeptidase [Prolixibacteraceae bacterium]